MLVNPSLDEAFYSRLRSIRSSLASKANIDPVEKIYRNQTYKILDLVKPLMFQASRVQKKTKAVSNSIRKTLTLRAVLYHDIKEAATRTTAPIGMWKPLSLLWVLLVAVSRASLRSGHA